MPNHNSAPPIGLHAHLVAAFTQASLHSITHTHTQQSFPCSGNAKVAATKTNGPIKQTWFPWSVNVHKVGWPDFALQLFQVWTRPLIMKNKNSKLITLWVLSK
jgi:hypothetical protein